MPFLVDLPAQKTPEIPVAIVTDKLPVLKSNPQTAAVSASH